jgi:hypothetical protein
MAELSLAAGDRRPTVRIVACHASERDLQPILWGLEEEGIPAEVEIALDGDAATLAKQAAHLSSLNVGIALEGIKDEIVLHHRDLEGESPLFRLAMRDAGAVQLRILGANAARLVKGDPLIFEKNEPVENRTGNPSAGVGMNSNQTVDLVVRAVLELLAKE